MDNTFPPDKDINNVITCSFCGRKQTQVKHIIAGKNAFICDQCISESKRVIQRESQTQSQAEVHLSESALPEENSIPKKEDSAFHSPLLTPKCIHKKLDEYVISQHNTKKNLAVAIFSHYQRIFHNYKSFDPPIELDKSNILMIGPSGSGKTLLATTLARAVDVPFVIADATTLTEAGYVGDDVENILLKLIQNADYDIERAEKGIIFIDEIDKVNRKSENPSITRDVSGEGVQQALLKIIEGTVASVPIKGGRKHPQSQSININTKNILFICGGAFIGLEDIIKKRLNTNTIGFQQGYDNKDEQAIIDKVSTDDLVKYGLIPEIVGRLPIVTCLEDLDEIALKDILIKPKNAIIKQFEVLLKLNEIDFEVDESALDYIVKLAKKMEIGARGMRSIIENIMRDIIYEAPEHTKEKVILTTKTIQSKKFFHPTAAAAKSTEKKANGNHSNKKSKSA